MTAISNCQVACVGRIVLDIYGNQLGNLIRDMHSYSSYIGGSSANIAVGLSRLNVRTTFISKIGDDNVGEFLKKRLIQEKVNVTQLKKDKIKQTGLCILSIYKPDSHPRDIFAQDSASFNHQVEDINVKQLKNLKIKYTKDENVAKNIAKQLANRKIIGWFQGGAEFGPRALGNRSILTAPFPKEMKDILNSKVKFRETFRPFAPAILSEFATSYFEIEQETPHMLIAAKVKSDKISEIPAVVHVDNTARIQTVSSSDNLNFRKLIEAFHDETACPVLLNTSFNVKGQPIVNSPIDAVKCFLSTEIDVLAIGDFVAYKNDQSF